MNRKYKKGSIILSKGDESNYLFAIISGEVQAYIDDENGKKIIVNTIGRDELCGELAMFSGEPRSANIVAVDDCEVLVIQKRDIYDVISSSSEFAVNIIEQLAQKVNALTDDVSSLALMDIYRRIARILEQNTSDSEDASATNRLTQQDIADHIGSSREMVSRILKDLRVGGYIEIENKRINIVKPLPKAW